MTHIHIYGGSCTGIATSVAVEVISSDVDCSGCGGWIWTVTFSPFSLMTALYMSPVVQSSALGAIGVVLSSCLFSVESLKLVTILSSSIEQ